MSIIEQLFAIVAVPATVILILQTLLLLIGLGGHALDNHDVHLDHDSNAFEAHIAHDYGEHFTDGHDVDAHGVNLFTLRGFVAFFSIFGWTGLACLQNNFLIIVSVIVAFVAGFVAMALVAAVMLVLVRSQSNGILNLANAIGQFGSVYIRVPAKRSEYGKVNIIVQEKLIEVNAVTDEINDLLPGKEIVVIDLADSSTLLVAKK